MILFLFSALLGFHFYLFFLNFFSHPPLSSYCFHFRSYFRGSFSLSIFPVCFQQIHNCNLTHFVLILFSRPPSNRPSRPRLHFHFRSQGLYCFPLTTFQSNHLSAPFHLRPLAPPFPPLTLLVFLLLLIFILQVYFLYITSHIH